MSKEKVQDCPECGDKAVSKTEAYKKHLSSIVTQTLGVKVSRAKAWELYKSIIHGTVEFVMNLDEAASKFDEAGVVKKVGTKTLPLAGIGTYEVLKTAPRGFKAGLDKEGNKIEGANVWPFVPRFRFYPSSVIDRYCELAYGLDEDPDFKIKHYGVFLKEEDVEVDDQIEDCDEEQDTTPDPPVVEENLDHQPPCKVVEEI